MGARNLDHALGRFMNVDPRAEDYNFQSVYAFANNNPVRFVDINGEGVDDWVERKDGKIEWDDNATSQATTKEGDTYLGKAVVVFNGKKNEKMGKYTGNTHGDYGKDVSLVGEGSELAEVIVYGQDKSISTFEGYTMSSDPSSFGVVANGDYKVNRVGSNEPLGPYGSPWVLESRGTQIPALDSTNPAFPDRNPGYLTNVFVHRPNKDGWSGTYTNSEGQLRGVSEGCLLIAPNQWDSFENKLQSINSFHLKLNRK